MDKAIQLVVVAMVAMITATVVVFLLQDRAGSFEQFLGSQQDNANCQVVESQIKSCQITQPSELPQSASSCSLPSIPAEGCGSSPSGSSGGATSSSGSNGGSQASDSSN